MALVSVQIDPAAGGVSQTEFSNHTHGYRKITRIGTDINKNYGTPTYADIVDDSEVISTPGNDIEAVGITVSTEQTDTPI